MCLCCWGRGATLRIGALEMVVRCCKAMWPSVEGEERTPSTHYERCSTLPWPSRVAPTLHSQGSWGVDHSILRYSTHDVRQVETTR